MPVLRTPPISVRLTASERAALEAVAGDRPVSQLLRERALSGLEVAPAPVPVARSRTFTRPPSLRVPTPELEALAPLAGQLGRATGALVQVARALREVGAGPEMRRAAEEELRQLRRVRADAGRAIRRIQRSLAQGSGE